MPGSRLYAAAQAQAVGLQGELARASAQVADLLCAREAAFARESALQLQVCSGTCVRAWCDIIGPIYACSAYVTCLANPWRLF